MDDELTYKIIGAAMKVHSELGCGFLEAVYQADFICFNSIIVELKDIY